MKPFFVLNVVIYSSKRLLCLRNNDSFNACNKLENEIMI